MTNRDYAKYPPQPIVRCEGYQPGEAVQEKEKKTILFLCTGNYYRSRFAEGLFNGVVGKLNLPWRASSKGLALERGAGNVGPMATAAVNALKAMGICAEDDCARAPAPVTVDDLERADWIIALKEAEHLPLLQERFPTWADAVEFWHVDDAPEALAVIEQEIMSLVARLL
jgi:protein-tyrosine phosphatase